jgi:O-methyltransferase involved in polyketide biosynthesis
MSEKIRPDLKGVSETLLMTLYSRAVESQRPDRLICDDRAVAMVNRMDFDFSHFLLQGHDVVALAMRIREIDSLARDFLSRNPQGLVVHVGCGLDTRFERVDNGRCEWVDLDLPQVVELRRQFIPAETPRCHLLGTSVLQDTWLEFIDQLGQRPRLVIAEGVFVYFEETQVKTLFLQLRDRFPGIELVCDAQSPFMIWANNLQLSVGQVKARMHWGLKHGSDVVGWGEGIKLLGEWYFFDHPEPRMGPILWMRRIPGMAKSTGVFHYRLG